MPSWLPPFRRLFLNPDARARAGSSDDLQAPSDLGGSLGHAGQADPATVPRLLNVEALALIVYFHPERLGQVQSNVRSRGVGVLDDVVQGLLRNAKETLVFGGRKGLAPLYFQSDRQILRQMAIRQ